MSSRVSNPNQWFVPYHLASDVLSEASVEDIAQKYEPNWMPETNKLERVFVQTLESKNTWSMMLKEVKNWRAYALDVTRRSGKTNKAGEDDMKKL
ncbi:hypothetical protein PIB30_040590 [Stylosanthes scabra]|uniref:Uncharacterized protein n=1 Tax=Stylosanthes scabra TaxID=79078 RepID=A0ABU6ZDE2_9FABA|nr:hypothetical protein [Stylosanthes scabra]